MEIIYTDSFKKKFNKLPKKIQGQFIKKVEIFIKDPFAPILKTHILKGNLVGLRAFSVTGNYRVIFRLLGFSSAKFVDIGTHSQVYGKHF